MENNELKPCPFCGGEAELVKEHFFGGDHYAGRCRSCAATSTFESTKEEAMTEWNRRVCVSEKPETLDTNSIAVKKLDTSTPCVLQNTETLDTNGSCTKKSYSCEAPRKPTYEELEKMIKIKWEKRVSGWRGDFTFDAFWITKSRDGWLDINGFDRNYGCVRTLKEAKLRVRYIILNFVADALGVERSGK